MLRISCVAFATGISSATSAAAGAPGAGLLVNGGFESGDLTGWAVVAAPGNVVMHTVGSSCQTIGTGEPRTGAFMHSASTLAGTPAGTRLVALQQVIDVSGNASIASGTATLNAGGWVAGAPGCGNSSDDLATITVEMRSGGAAGELLAVAAAGPIDPPPGGWTPLLIEPTAVPQDTDTVVLRYEAALDPGAASIDVAADDLFLQIPGLCAADFDASGDVGVSDLLMLLSAWGDCGGCMEDLDNDAVVGVSDLLELLSAWGLCS